MAAFDDRLLLAQAGAALTIANLRFWTTVAPLVKTQLTRWEQRAYAITNPTLQTLAANKLRDEHFNAEVASTLATLCPPPHRPAVVEALVAYEILYDYLDGLTEIPSTEPIRDGHQLYRALSDAITPTPPPETTDYFCYLPASDGGYLHDLVCTVQGALNSLPAYGNVAPIARRASRRCAEAQIRAHATAHLGTTQLEGWAKHETNGLEPPLGWQCFLAGAASSVLTIHALIAAGADESTTPQQAASIDTIYLSTAVLSTLLDGLIDYQDDKRDGHPSYLRYYTDSEHLTHGLVSAARRAIQHARPLRNGPHHAMTTVGVVAYYMSAPGGKSAYARGVTSQLQRELSPLLRPTLSIMRAWRAAKRTRRPVAASATPACDNPSRPRS